MKPPQRRRRRGTHGLVACLVVFPLSSRATVDPAATSSSSSREPSDGASGQAGSRPPGDVPPRSRLAASPEGGAPVVESVDVRGAHPTRRAGLRAVVDLPAGGPLDEQAVEAARLRLLGSGLVRRAEARLERGTRRGRVRIVFEVEERATLGLDAIHLGAAQPTPLWLGAEVTDLDPFGLGFAMGGGVVSSGAQTGARLSLGLQDGPRFTARFVDGREPFVGPRGQRRDGVDVDDLPLAYTRAGGEVGLTRPVSPVLRADVRLRGEFVQADAPRDAEQVETDGAVGPFDFQIRHGGSAFFELGLGLEWDERDDPVRPTRGTRAQALARAGGGDYAWLAVQGGVEHHFRLPWRHGLRVDLQAGAMTGDAPFFERFFVGDLHPYIPARALGVNFARRRGPQLVDGDLDAQRYEDIAGRLGLEYRLPLGAPDGPYPVDLFFGGALLALGSPGDPPDEGRRPLPFGAALDAGLRFETDVGVLGVGVGSLLQWAGP